MKTGRPDQSLILQMGAPISMTGCMPLLLRGTVTTILLLSCQNCGAILTQNLCSQQETLEEPQEEDIKRFPKGEQNSVFFWRYFPLTMTKLENVRLTFSSCSPCI